jgi:LAO/AO transport system kinase
MGASGEISSRRAGQARSWMWNEIQESLIEAFKAHPQVRADLATLEAQVAAGTLAPTAAARGLLEAFLGRFRAPP